MRPSEATAVIGGDRSVGVLIDRRKLSTARSLPEDLRFVATIELDRAEGVVASLVRASDGGDLPVRGPANAIGPGAHIRLLDRFYLPAVRDSGVVAPLFDLAADLYDEITDQQLNRRVARLLLRAVLPNDIPHATILDFGCGTGIGALALSDLSTSSCLVGVDLSESMLRHAAKRGMETMRIQDWRSSPPTVDGAIAAFVLHYGVSQIDLRILAQGLKPGAAFAANFFGSEAAVVAETVGELDRVGLVLERTSPLDGASKPDVLLIFRKRT